MVDQAKRFARAPAMFLPSGLKVFENDRSTTEPRRDIVAALIPHISQDWGFECYCRTAAALMNSPQPNIVYVFGFNHRAYRTPHIFHATRCPYVLGNAEIQVCSETMSKLEKVVGRHNFYHDDLHAADWTIENALPPVLFAYGSSWKMVPIIIEHRHRMFTNDRHASEMLDAVAASVQDHIDAGRRVLLIAAVDLSHHGAFFGDRRSTPKSREALEAFDQQYLAKVFSLDAAAAEEFLGTNETKNDAIAAMSLVGRVACMTKLAHSGELLHFDRYFGREVDRYVTIASGFLLGRS